MMKPKEDENAGVKPAAAPALSVSAWVWVAGMALVLGQGLISLGRSSYDVEVFAGAVVCVLSALWMVFLTRVHAKSYWQETPRKTFREDWILSLLTLGMLLVLSYLNFRIIRIGYSEDEFGEWACMGIVAFKRGWLWWGHIDQMMDSSLAGLCARWFGVKFESIKLAALLYRTGAGLLAWLLARELFGSRIGTLTGWIVGTSVMYMCSFNDVIKEIPAPFAFLACLYFTFLGWRKRSSAVLFAGGAFAALGYYAYVSFYALLPVLVIWGFVGAWTLWTRAALRSGAKLLLGWAAGFVLLMLPAAYYVWRYPYLQAHFPFASVLTQGAFVESENALHGGGVVLPIRIFWREIMSIMQAGSPSFTFNFDSCPMLWWPWAVVFWIGILVMLRRITESRIYVLFLLMMSLACLASLNMMFTPNVKITRPALLLCAVPAAIGLDYVCFCLSGGGRRRWVRWIPFLAVMASLAYGAVKLGQVMTHPANWWYRAANTMKPREDYVYAHPEYRFWEVGAPITDIRTNSPVTTVNSVRQVLETPNDGRDFVFLFPCGRQEWMPKINALVNVWGSIYPGGEVKVHTVPVKMHGVPAREGQWPTFVSYRVPAAVRWWLPAVQTNEPDARQAAGWWQRAGLLHQHGLILEAWRDALKAAQKDTNYYTKADALLGNSKGPEARLALLINGQLWNEARQDLEFRSGQGVLSGREQAWKAFLDAHGLEMRLYSTYTGDEPPRQVFRQYEPALHMGIVSLASGSHLSGAFPARQVGRLYVPRAGNYRFDMKGGDWHAKTLQIDGRTVLQVSCKDIYRILRPSESVHLSKGLHEFSAENCTFVRFKGELPKGVCTPDVLNYLYGFESVWELKWQFEEGPMVPISPDFLVAPNASFVPRPN